MYTRLVRADCDSTVQIIFSFVVIRFLSRKVSDRSVTKALCIGSCLLPALYHATILLNSIH